MSRSSPHRWCLVWAYAAAVLGGFLFFIPFAKADIVNVTSNISTTTTWTSNHTYFVKTAVSINSGITLTIASGTIVKFASSSDLLNNGTLNADGDPANFVYFTSANDNSVGSTTPSSTGNPVAGDWICVGAASGASTTITNATIRYGGNKSYNCESGITQADVGITGGTATLIDDTFASGTSYGVKVTGGTVSVTSSTFSSDGLYGLYESTGAPSVTLTSSTFSGNASGTAYIDVAGGATFTPSGNTSTIASGTIGGFVIWDTTKVNETLYQDLPYVITNAAGSLTVSSGTKLTVNPGTIIKLASSSLLVNQNGVLDAEGTTGSPIYFTSIRDNSVDQGTNGTTTSTPAAGDWACIGTNPGASTTITNAVVRYGGGTGANCVSGLSNATVSNNGTTTLASDVIASSTYYGLAVSGGALTITLSTFSNSRYGIYQDAGKTTVTNSAFENNTIYGADNSPNVTSTLNAIDNYWNAASGPHNTSTNPSGTGDAVSNLITYNPWLTQSPINPTTTVGNLVQYKSDGATQLVEGSSTTESVITFSGQLMSNATSKESLQVEVQPAGTAFANTVTVSSTSVAPGSTATVVYPVPDTRESSGNGHFHWQARAADQAGDVSPWQYFGPNASSTDFSIDTVPEYTQQSSTYPSTTSTASWADSSYDNSSDTIAQEGCAITAAVMDLRYMKVTTNVSGTDVNPLTLNNWLTSTTNGYIAGAVNWTKIPLYAQTATGQWTISSTVDSENGSWATLSSTVNSYLNTSATIPVILYEADAPNGNSTTTHFVDATGFAVNQGATTYTIRDPIWYNTEYLNQATGTAWVNNYSNDYSGIDVFLPMSGYGGGLRPLTMSQFTPLTSQEAPMHIVYAVRFPETLMLIDSSGRRTGQDPQTGAFYREIPYTSYTRQQTSWQLVFYSPPAGKYSIQITGGHAGQYDFETDIFDGHNSLVTPIYSGSIQPGQIVTYSQNYDPNNLASSTVINE